MYYIYYIPDKKIGCTDNITRRVMKQQGYTDWALLETHSDIYVASEREIELQKKYDMPVDKIPYYKTIENSEKAWVKKRTNLQMESIKKAQPIGCVLGGKIQGKIRAEQISVSITAFTKKTKDLVGVYKSITECARQLGLHQADITHCLNPNKSQYSTKGYTFIKN
jgi:hypothetical protein